MLKKKLVQTNAEIEIIKSFKSNHHQIVLFQRAWALEAELRISPYQPDAMSKSLSLLNFTSCSMHGL
jgi:hypothetical protein